MSKKREQRNQSLVRLYDTNEYTIRTLGQLFKISHPRVSAILKKYRKLSLQLTLFGRGSIPKRKLSRSETIKRLWQNPEYRKKFLRSNSRFWRGGKTLKPNYRKEKAAKWYQQNREKVINQARKWQRENQEKRKIWNRKYVRKRRKTILKIRLSHNMSRTIHALLRGKQKNSRWEDLVGYTIRDLIAHLEKQFDEKMNWENYGSYWWIDHILPIASFKFNSPDDPQFKQCWDLKNLRPLEKIANIKKGKRVK